MDTCAHQLKNRLNRFVLRTAGWYQDQKPFWLMRYLFAINGISLEFKCGGFWRFIWTVHRMLLCLHVMIFLTDQFVTACAEERSFGRRLFNIHLILVTVVVMLRHLCMTLKMTSMGTLKKYCLENEFLRRDEKAMAMREKMWNRLKRMELGMVCQGSVQFLIFVLTDVQEAISMQFPFDFSDTSVVLQFMCKNLYTMYYACYCLAISMNCYVLFAIMLCLITELMLVVDAFGSVFKDSLQPRQEYRFDMTKQDILNFWNALEEHIRKCCRQHVEFIAMIRVLNTFTKETFLLVYGAALGFTAIEIYQILSTKQIGFYEFMILQDTVVFYVEFFCFCWLATKLNDLNNQIANRIYEQEWHSEMQYSDDLPEQYRSVKQSLLIVMINAQRSLGVSVGGVYELSLELMVELLHNSYSTLMFLLEVTK
ncbi:uncharacterized protein LOC6036613 [Culex quinquefasciatus]|uniref:uncharacterized protein LOC6036613 n=1 Tax=Culex quinquefasciatus TaxID=7176 RepID=UPI0018E319A3|nr:uncharacterized protein LOC6036613 [Culex quinquefasciatus]